MKKVFPRERSLQPWSSSTDDTTFEPLGYKNSDSNWDQFKANEQKFGYIKNPINETIYTTPLDKKSELYQSKIEEAERLSREILASSHSNLHILEERGEPISSKDHEIDEEKYASVSRTIVRSSGAYVPPSLRSKEPSVPQACSAEYSGNVLVEEINFATPILNDISSEQHHFIEQATVNEAVNSSDHVNTNENSSGKDASSELECDIISCSTKSSDNASSPAFIEREFLDGPTTQSIDTINPVSIKEQPTLKAVKLNINAPEFYPKRNSFAFQQPQNSYYSPGYYSYASSDVPAISYYDPTGAVYFPSGQYSYYYDPPGTPYNVASRYKKNNGTQDTSYDSDSKR